MLKSFCLSDTGRVRPHNEDSVFACENRVGKLPNLFIVADGMGGYNGGDVASKIAVDTFIEYVENSDETDIKNLFTKAYGICSLAILEVSRSNESLSGMGTTLVAASVSGDCLNIANVGDSRGYIVNGNEIRQITKDHSLVAEMVRLGAIDEASATNHPYKNRITKAVGVGEAVPDLFALKVKKGDKILLCTDGLTNMLDDNEIKIIIKKSKDIESASKELIELANRNGGKDNISVLLIDPFA